MRGNLDPYGSYRSLDPQGSLPQQAWKLDAVSALQETELLIEVESLNIDSASFKQIKDACAGDKELMKKHILELVEKRGKMHNPVTGSGGMLLGTVKKLGKDFYQFDRPRVEIGQKIATLVSLSLTPLKIRSIKDIKLDCDRVDVEAEAILFPSGIFSVIPSDIPEKLCLAVLDVCGAPAQTARICKPGQTVVIFGGAGKSGLLSLYQAKKNVGPQGRVIALDYDKKQVEALKRFSFVDEAIECDARKAIECFKIISDATKGKMADVVINVTNIPDTEMSCVLAAKQGGLVYFFSMATSFTKAALGAEGVGSDVELIIGNGFVPGHDELSLNILRESEEIRKVYEAKYG